MKWQTWVRTLLFLVNWQSWVIKAATDVKWIRDSLDEMKETHDELEGRVRELEGWRRGRDVTDKDYDKKKAPIYYWDFAS